MPQVADFRLDETPRGQTAVLTGDWTAVEMGAAADRLRDSLKGAPGAILDLSGIGRCDTSGAWGLLRASQRKADSDDIIASPELRGLLALVERATQVERVPTPRPRIFHALFDRIGRGVVDIGETFFDTMVFNGHLLVAIGRAAANPRRMRLRSTNAATSWRLVCGE